MPIPKPSKARIVVRHFEDGRMRVFIDDKPLPGVVDVKVQQVPGSRSVLHLTIIGLAYRVEQSSFRSSQQQDEATEHDADRND